MPRFHPGDRVTITCENQEAELPDNCEAENLGNHRIQIGTEAVIPGEEDYDGYDNSWLIRASGKQAWIHEGALEEAIKPVTKDEEDEALASILKALNE